MDVSRRQLIQGGAVAAGLMACAPARALGSPVYPIVRPEQPRINPVLLDRAKAALERNRHRVKAADLIAIADYAKPSRDQRFYLVNLPGGMVTAYQVAHGRGSDPHHIGWLERFSNEVGSEASSNGAYVTDDVYYGRYGRSLRLHGLDYSNSNANARAIVVHSAWYAEPEVAESTGKLGRSEGCFTLSELSLQYVLFRLGAGRLLYADKVV